MLQPRPGRAWRAAAARAAGGLHRVPLRLDQIIYFCVATAAVHLSAGRPGEALALFTALQAELAKLPDHHPNRALVISCQAYALHCTGDLHNAFNHFVQAYVLRSSHPALGPQHVDTALAAHNLGCCLDELGKVHRAMELVAGAHQVFLTALGSTHPRTETAVRNLKLVSGKCVQLEMHYVPTGTNGKAPTPEPAAGTRKAKGGVDRRAAAEAAAATAAGIASGASSHPPVPLMSPQQRLAAFQLRQGTKAAGAASKVRFKKPRDLDYLGGGIYAATPAMVDMWQRMQPLVKAHAAGSLFKNLPDDVVVVPHTQTAGAAKGSGGTHAGVPSRPAAPPPVSLSPPAQPLQPLSSAVAAPWPRNASESAALPLPVPGLARLPSPATGRQAAEVADATGPVGNAGATVAMTKLPGAARSGGPRLDQLLGSAVLLPRIAYKGGVVDASLEQRRIEPKAAAQLYQSALKAGIKLPDLMPIIRASGGVPAGSSARSPTSKRASSRASTERFVKPVIVVDRLGDLLAPKVVKPKRKQVPLNKNRKGVAAGGTGQAAKNSDADDEEEVEEDEDELEGGSSEQADEDEDGSDA